MPEVSSLDNSYDPEALAGRIEPLLKTGEFETALLLIDQALEQHPANGVAYRLLGRALADLGKTQEALDALNTACFFSDDPAGCLCDIGDLHNRLSHFDEAAAAYRQALTYSPEDGLIHAALALALSEEGALEEARREAEQAAHLAPGQAQPFYLLGKVDNLQGRYQESVAWLEKALALDPHHAEAHTALGLSRLMRGNWEATSWEHYAWRFRRPPFLAPPEAFAALPVWEGNPAGARVLIWGEQGIGDRVFSLGFLRELGLNPSQMVLCFDERLLPLCERSFPGVAVSNAWPRSPEEEGITHTLPCCSVAGLVLRSGKPRRPAPFLKADPHLVQDYVADLRGDGREILLGISWRSQQTRYGDNKSIPLQEFAPLAAVPGVKLVDLQYADTEEERVQFHYATGKYLLHPPLDRYGDIDGLTALISACDGIMTTCNVTAHLAGALGRQGWILPPDNHGLIWYWSHEPGRSPWYPSLQLMPKLLKGNRVSAMVNIAETLCEISPD